MNRIYTRFLRAIAFILLLAIQAKAQTANPAYNKTLADSLGLTSMV